MIVLSGDSHNAWGYNLGDSDNGGKRVAAGVEFAGQSVTSPGFEGWVPEIPSANISKAMRETNPELAFMDASRRGYVSLEIKPADVTGTWHFMADTRNRTTALSGTQTMRVRRNVKTLEAV
jgi:alkaline phosphatase D